MKQFIRVIIYILVKIAVLKWDPALMTLSWKPVSKFSRTTPASNTESNTENTTGTAGTIGTGGTVSGTAGI